MCGGSKGQIAEKLVSQKPFSEIVYMYKHFIFLSTYTLRLLVLRIKRLGGYIKNSYLMILLLLTAEIFYMI